MQMDEDDCVDTMENDTLELAVQKYEHYVTTNVAIYKGLTVAFREVMRYAQVFEPYKNIFFENAAYIQEVQEIYKDVDLNEYRKAIEKYKEQGGDFQSIPCC